MIIGHEKGSDTEGRIKHNFGMARPEGYRKAQRLMEMADRFSLPVVSLVDTAGAYPGIGAEERGQAEAIARCTDTCLSLGVPIVSVIIGEGGSGGAVAIATANRVYMLEHAIYTVASPEAAASILWRDSSRRRRCRHQYEDHRPGPAQAWGHRRHHPRAHRGRPPGREGSGRGNRGSNRPGFGRIRRHDAGGHPQGEAGEIPGHRPYKLRILPRKTPLLSPTVTLLPL